MLQQNPMMAQLEKEFASLMEGASNRRDKIPFFKFQKDVNKTYYFRPLPTKTEGKLMPVVKISSHYNLYNPNTEKNGAFPCLRDHGLQCPICDAIEQIMMSDNFEKQALAEEMIANPTYYMYAINCETNELGCLTFNGVRSAEAILGKFKEIMIETGKTGAELEDGVILRIDKSGSKQNTKYQVAVAQRNTPMPASYQPAYANLEPLINIMGQYTSEDYHKILRGEKTEQVDARKNTLFDIPTPQQPVQQQIPQVRPEAFPQAQTWQTPNIPQQMPPQNDFNTGRIEIPNNMLGNTHVNHNFTQSQPVQTVNGTDHQHFMPPQQQSAPQQYVAQQPPQQNFFQNLTPPNNVPQQQQGTQGMGGFAPLQTSPSVGQSPDFPQQVVNPSPSLFQNQTTPQQPQMGLDDMYKHFQNNVNTTGAGPSLEDFQKMMGVK